MKGFLAADAARRAALKSLAGWPKPCQTCKEQEWRWLLGSVTFSWMAYQLECNEEHTANERVAFVFSEAEVATPSLVVAAELGWRYCPGKTGGWWQS